VEHDFYRALSKEKPADVSSYTQPFLEQFLSLDLRNDPQRPRLGVYAQLLAQESSRLGSYGSWDYLRILPEVRGYVPLFLDMVLAARFATGALYVYESAAGLDPKTAVLGPEVYRLRGGGPTSNRGFASGRLGAGTEGSSRRFEGSLELRIPLGGDLGLVFFGDIGDVWTSFRWNYLNTAAGFGLRYYTLIGAIRFDAGWRIPGAQVIGHEPSPVYKANGWPSAVHLTIGEAF
jgi:outer membrane protein assembly factor BamA